MSLQDLGSLGEFVGALAVIVSLLYLAFQIRQNTQALHSSAYAESAEQLWLVNLAIAQDAELARIFSGALEGRFPNAEDEIRFVCATDNLFFGLENLFHSYERGILDPDTWSNVVENGVRRMAPVALERWQRRQGPITQRLVKDLKARGAM